ncbi:MAG: ribokinase [Actinomycetota bacterium]|nr:ribokinase [Actinomycetota bacterium]
MRAAVVGHVEWIEFLRVEHLPAAGEIVHATEWWAEPAGGGAAAAEQLRRLTGDAMFVTALGDDELAKRADEILSSFGLEVHAAVRRGPTRRGVTQIDQTGERTITVVGERLSPRADDPLPWDRLTGVDALYFSAGDVGALRAARKARVVVATTRVFPTLIEAGVRVDALIGSAADPTERRDPAVLDPPPRLVVWTEGAAGGTFTVDGKEPRRYEAAPLPGPVVDRYGAGDSFAATLAFGLASTGDIERALQLAARAAASVLTGRGPYTGQLTSEQLGE